MDGSGAEEIDRMFQVQDRARRLAVFGAIPIVVLTCVLIWTGVRYTSQLDRAASPESFEQLITGPVSELHVALARAYELAVRHAVAVIKLVFFLSLNTIAVVSIVLMWIGRKRDRHAMVWAHIRKLEQQIQELRKELQSRSDG